MFTVQMTGQPDQHLNLAHARMVERINAERASKGMPLIGPIKDHMQYVVDEEYKRLKLLHNDTILLEQKIAGSLTKLSPEQLQALLQWMVSQGLAQPGM